MSKTGIAIALAAVSMSAATSFAEGFDSSMFSVKGFGTVGMVHSSEDKADFTASQFQPNGAGQTHNWDMGIDSKLGVQLNANFTDNFSAVVQAVSQHQYDDTWRPLIEWANIKYQITPEFSVRLGRIVLPAFLISDSRMVGYSNPWVRPPEEVYFNSLTTNSDGGDITYREQFGSVTNTVQAFYGRATAKLPTSTMKAKPDWGINDSVEFDAVTLRAGYVSYKVDFASGMDQLRDAQAQFADSITGTDPEIAAQTQAQLNKYDPDGMNIRVYTLGANYDPGEWFTMGEYVHVQGDSFLSDSDSFYVTTGYRIAQFTPYVTFSQVKADNAKPYHVDASNANTLLAAGGAAFFNSVYDATFAAGQASQRTISMGVRWDFMPSADLKVQYDRKSLLDDSTGRLLISPAGSSYQGSDQFNIFSAAIDFVF